MTKGGPDMFRELRDRLHKALAGTVVGYAHVIDDLLVTLVAGGHVLMEGIPGVAKTTLAKTFAHVLAMDFRRIQFTQDLLPGDITGHAYFDPGTQTFGTRKGPVFANVLLADELNRAPPKTQSALLEAMEEHQVTIEGETFPLPDPFFVVATMNPIEVQGVYGLPEAQLDRFMVRTRMAYLSPELERRMMQSKSRAAAAPSGLRVRHSFIVHARDQARRVRVDDRVLDYMHQVGLATRSHEACALGASPRALEQLLRAGRARALLHGRPFVTPDDVKHLAPRVLAHRLILHPDAEADGVTSDQVVADAVAATPVPTGLEVPEGQATPAKQ